MLKPLIPPLSHPHRILGLSAPLNFTQEQGRGSKWVKVQQWGKKNTFPFCHAYVKMAASKSVQGIIRPGAMILLSPGPAEISR